MTVQCLICAKLDMQEFPKHAAQGVGHCPHDVAGKFVPVKVDRECRRFKPATAEISAARVEWSLKL